jgi:hypothetical protein
MDEACSRPLHRLLSFFRLLMQFHPRLGAQQYATHVFGFTDLKPGWNAVHAAPGAQRRVKYIRIGPEAGLSSWEKPDVPESEIHHVDETQIPEFAQSPARRAMIELAEEVTSLNLPVFDAEQIRATLAHIDVASRQPLRGPNPLVDARITHELSRLKKLIGENAALPKLIEPLCDVMRDCLSFRLTGTHAANVLSVLLAHYLRLPSPLDRSPLADRIMANVEHLIELVVALKNDRQRWNLSSFYTATSLALLLGDTALLMCDQLADRAQLSAEQRRFGERRGLYIDELMAHELSPCLMHPIDFAPCTLAEALHAQRFGIADAGGTYAGAEVEVAGPVDFTRDWSKLTAYSEHAEAMDVVLSITDANHPLSMPERERLFMFLLTMELGRGERGTPEGQSGSQ